jgi:hypothetical protein
VVRQCGVVKIFGKTPDRTLAARDDFQRRQFRSKLNVKKDAGLWRACSCTATDAARCAMLATTDPIGWRAHESL